MNRPAATLVLLALLSAADATAQPHALTVRSAPGEPQLQSLDFATGALIPIGPLGRSFDQGDLAFLPGGNLVAVEAVAGVLLAIDPATGQATVIGDLGIDSFIVYGLAADACGRLWMVGESADTWTLYEIDPATGAAEQRGTLSEPASGLAARGESLFALTAGSGPRSIVQIDPADVGLIEVAALDGLPSFHLSMGLDFGDPGTVLDLGHDLIPVTSPPFLNSIYRIGLDGEVSDGIFLGVNVVHQGLAAGPPTGICPGGSPIPVPAVSPAGVAILALLVASLGAAAVRRRGRA